MNTLTHDKKHLRLLVVLTIGIVVVICGASIAHWLDARQKSSAIQNAKAYFNGQPMEYHPSSQGAWQLDLYDGGQLKIYMKSTNGQPSWGNWIIVMAELTDPEHHTPEIYKLESHFSYPLSRAYGDPHHQLFPEADTMEAALHQIEMGEYQDKDMAEIYDLRIQKDVGAVRQRLVALKFIRQEKRWGRLPQTQPSTSQ